MVKRANKKEAPKRNFTIPIIIIKVLLIIAVAAAVAVWYAITHSPTAVVKKQILNAAELFSKQPSESNASTAFRLIAFENALDDYVECNVSGFPYNGRESANSFASLVFRGRAYPRSIEITVSAMEVEFPAKNKAEVRCQAKAYIAMDGNSVNESRLCVITLCKRDNGWKIAGFKEDTLIKK